MASLTEVAVRRPDRESRPDREYPAGCPAGHSGQALRKPVGWLDCLCAGGRGHLLVWCATPGCGITWYDPPHDAEVNAGSAPDPADRCHVARQDAG